MLCSDIFGLFSAPQRTHEYSVGRTYRVEKHSVSVIKTSQLMLCSETIAVCFQISQST
jgi:hypothetical protein